MEQIIVEIDQQGNTTVAVKGVKGSGCQKLTADLEAALGKVTKTERTREYAERPQQTNRAEQR